MDRLQAVSKSIWKERYNRGFSFLCPLCAIPRRIGLHPRPGHPVHFFQVFIAALFFTVVTWSWFEWKGIVSFVPFWITFEVFYRAKVRASLVCQKCGFDPVLYLVDVTRARAAVESHWKRKFEEKGIPYPSARTGSYAAQHEPPPKSAPDSEEELEKNALKSASGKSKVSEEITH